MQTPALGKLIADCWIDAENAVRERIKEKYYDEDEEFITELLRGELRTELGQASDDRSFEKAFLSDLKRAFPFRTDELPSNVERDLIATLSFHPKHVEAKTGGDLGIVVVRPNVQMSSFELLIDDDHKRGLLCQAKIFERKSRGRKSRWGSLTDNQVKALPGKTDYSSLLLYRYTDQEAERRDLQPFAWQLTRGATVEQIRSWLASDTFTQLSDSRVILQDLMGDKIGTGDKALIDRDVAPPGLRESLVIKIRWKDGRDPGLRVPLRQNFAVRQAQQVMLRRS